MWKGVIRVVLLYPKSLVDILKHARYLLRASRNLWKICLPKNWSLVSKSLGIAALWDAKWEDPEEMREGTPYGVEGFRTAADKKGRGQVRIRFRQEEPFPPRLTRACQAPRARMRFRSQGLGAGQGLKQKRISAWGAHSSDHQWR